VAGTAAGIFGVARAARIIGISVFHRDPATGGPLSYTSDQIWGLWRVYNLRTTYPIAAVNLSIGGGRATAYCDNRTSSSSFYSWAAVLRSANIATVVSSGNDNYSNAISSPACNSDVVSVGNTTLTPAGADAVFGGVSGGSNSASFLSVLAPGTQICSSVPVSSVECGWIGTSMAAPHVTGAVAVLKQLRPGASVAQSLASLQYGGVSVTDSRNNVTKARINVWGALVYMYGHY
jgi:subtilisin